MNFLEQRFAMVDNPHANYRKLAEVSGVGARKAPPRYSSRKPVQETCSSWLLTFWLLKFPSPSTLFVVPKDVVYTLYSVEKGLIHYVAFYTRSPCFSRSERIGPHP